MNATSLKPALAYISKVMKENQSYLAELDRKNGDGDLGVSMSYGFSAISDHIQIANEKNLGKLFYELSKKFNESASSTLGTIISFGLVGMSRTLADKQEITLEELAQAFEAGIKLIMERAKSKPGEKTILDSICPAVDALIEHAAEDKNIAFREAAKAAYEGSIRTKNMVSIHGRAAYYGEKSLGVLDGGAVVGKLLFEALYNYYNGMTSDSQ